MHLWMPGTWTLIAVELVVLYFAWARVRPVHRTAAILLAAAPAFALAVDALNLLFQAAVLFGDRAGLLPPIASLNETAWEGRILLVMAFFLVVPQSLHGLSLGTTAIALALMARALRGTRWDDSQMIEDRP